MAVYDPSKSLDEPLNISMPSPPSYVGEEQPLVGKGPPPMPISNNLRTFINVTKGFVGAASFALPAAFENGGLAGASIGTCVLGILTMYTLVNLTQSGRLVPPGYGRLGYPTYPDVGHAAFGLPGKLLVWAGIVLLTLGAVGAYFVFIGTAIANIIADFAPNAPSIFKNDAFCILLVVPIFVLLSWFRSPRALAPVSAIGLGGLVVSLAISFIYVLVDGCARPIEEYKPMVRWDTYPLFIGNAAFLYLIHSIVLPVSQSMATPSDWPKVVGASIAAVTVVNIIFCDVAYVFLFHPADNIVTDVWPHTWRQAFLRVFLSIDLLATGALLMFPVTDSLEREILDPRKYGQPRTEWTRNAMRACFVFLSAGFAAAIPNFGVVTSLSGGLANVLCGFVLPPVLYLRLRWMRNGREWFATRWGMVETAVNVFFFVFGCVIMVMTTRLNVIAIIDSYKPAGAPKEIPFCNGTFPPEPPLANFTLP